MNHNGIRLAAACLLLAGCGNQESANRSNAQTAGRLAAATVLEDQAPIRPGHAVFLGETHVGDEHGDGVPDRFEGPQGFAWTPPKDRKLTLADIAGRISRFTHLGVNIEEGSPPVAAGLADRVSPAQGVATPRLLAASSETKPDRTADAINDLIGEPRGFPESGRGEARAIEPAEQIDPYVGPLSGFLTIVATSFGREWEVHGQTVYLPKLLTREYEVVDFNADTTTTGGLTGAASAGAASASGAGGAGAGSAGTGGSSSGQNSNTTMTLKPFEEVVKAVGLLAGDKNVIAAPASHELVVRCPRLCQEQVGGYLREHNRDASRTIHLVVAVRSLSDSGSDEYGFSPTLVYQDLGFSVAVNPQGSELPAAPTPGSVIASILNPPVGSAASPFSGSSLSLQALSQLDKQTTGITKEGFIANNHALALRNALDFSFVNQSSTTTTSTALATATTSLTTLIIGDQLEVLAHLSGDGHIRLSLALSQTAIQSFGTADLGNGASTIFPQVSDNATAPVEFTILDGQTIILTDVANRTSGNALSGSCGVYCWLLGGSDSATNSNTRTLLVITAEEVHSGDRDGSSLGRRAE